MQCKANKVKLKCIASIESTKSTINYCLGLSATRIYVVRTRGDDNDVDDIP